MDMRGVPMSRDSLFKYNHHSSTNISAEILGQRHHCSRFIPSFTLNVMSLLKNRQVQEDKKVKWFRFVFVIELFLVDKDLLKVLFPLRGATLQIRHCHLIYNVTFPLLITTTKWVDVEAEFTPTLGTTGM